MHLHTRTNAHTYTALHMTTKVTNAKGSQAEENAQKRLSTTKWQQPNKFACAYMRVQTVYSFVHVLISNAVAFITLASCKTVSLN